MQFSYSCETVMIFQNNESSPVDLPIVYGPKIGSYIQMVDFLPNYELFFNDLGNNSPL